MRLIRLAAAALLLAGCGIQPSGVTGGGEAPTGVAPGVTLYLVDSQGRLRPAPRPSGHLGTIPEALALLLTGTTSPGLHTEIAEDVSTRVIVVTRPGAIVIMTPLTLQDVTQRGIDQIVCTALGVHVQSGGSRDTKVQVRFTLSTPESDELRTCPLIK